MRAKALDEATRGGRLPIFVGGTGLYFKALTRGPFGVPPIPAEVRDDVRARLERERRRGAACGTGAARSRRGRALKPRDRTRIARALEVVEATGRSLPDWHREGHAAAAADATAFARCFSRPSATSSMRRIDARFDAMLAAGALEEVARLAARQLDPLLPAMKAHGVPALIRHLRGEISLEEAADVGRADTRRYAKRQFTWFRHQLPDSNG